MSEWLTDELRKIAGCENIKKYFFKNGKKDENYNCWTISNGKDEITIWLFKGEEYLSALSNGKNVLHEYYEKNSKRRHGVDEKTFRDYLRTRLRDKGIL